MPVLRVLNLNDPMVVAARKKFNSPKASASRKSPLTFEDYLDFFSQDCNSFRTIGRQAGLTNARIRQIYNDYFANLFPHRPNGRKRQKLCTIKRFKIATETLPEKSGLLRDVMKKVINLGYKIKRIQRTSSFAYTRKFYERRLIVNGYRCYLLAVRKFRPGSGCCRLYHQIRLNQSSFDQNEFFIMQTTHKRAFYVVPIIFWSQLWINSKNKSRYRSFYIPTEDYPVYRNQHSLISFKEFDQYREAWHLLGAPKDKQC